MSTSIASRLAIRRELRRQRAELESVRKSDQYLALQSATRIQAHMRGWIVRQWFAAMLNDEIAASQSDVFGLDFIVARTPRAIARAAAKIQVNSH